MIGSKSTTTASMAAELGERVLNAAKAGDVSELNKLVVSGVDKDFAGTGGRTALMHAAIHGRDNVIEYLVSAGARVNKTSNVCRLRSFFLRLSLI
jgi:ankyrin repeat protein